MSVTWSCHKVIYGNVAIGSGTVFWLEQYTSFSFHNIGYDSKRNFVAGAGSIGEYHSDRFGGLPG
jgi:hypothetical protein